MTKRRTPLKVHQTRCFRRERMKEPSAFAPGSFRTVVHQSGVRVVVGCPKGKWNARTKRCKVGTRAQAVLKPTGRCQ